MFLRRLDKENEYQEGKKSLNERHKSYKSWQTADLAGYDQTKAELKQQREHLKKNYETGKQQIEYLERMEYLLQQKLRFKKEGRDSTKLRGTEQRTGQMDILIMNNE